MHTIVGTANKIADFLEASLLLLSITKPSGPTAWHPVCNFLEVEIDSPDPLPNIQQELKRLSSGLCHAGFIATTARHCQHSVLSLTGDCV